MWHLELCGNINPEQGDEHNGKSYKESRTRQEKCGAVYHTEGEGRFRLTSQRTRIEPERIGGENRQAGYSLGTPSQRVGFSGKIVGHLIDDCHDRLDRNNRQMSRNEQNVKFLKEQIAHLEQEQADLALENESIESRILDLRGIDDQMANPQ